MRIISSCKMGPGTFEAKFNPLERLPIISDIYVLRKNKLFGYSKVKFIKLPILCSNSIFNVVLTPFILLYNTLKYKVDYILAYHLIPHAFFAYFASVFSGKPYILGQTGLFIQRYAEKPFIGPLIVGVVKHALCINVPGTCSRDFWISKGVDSNSINILHSTVDTEFFKPLGTKPEFDFIYLGRLAPEKQIHIQIEALHRLHIKGVKATMVIVGDGVERIKLEELVKRYDLCDSIMFVGFQMDVLCWFNKASICLLSSVSEGLPTSLMQAMACELICVSANVGNIPDMIQHGKNGFLVETASVECFSETMVRALDALDASDLRLNARRTIVDSHSYESVINKWEQIFNN